MQNIKGVQGDLTTAPENNWNNYVGLTNNYLAYPNGLDLTNIEKLDKSVYDEIIATLGNYIAEDNRRVVDGNKKHFFITLSNFTSCFDDPGNNSSTVNLKSNLTVAQKTELARLVTLSGFWKTGHIYEANGIRYEPYRPQYNAIMTYGRYSDPARDASVYYYYPRWEDYAQSSGTDCTGLQFLATAYSGSDYWFAKDNSPTYDQPFYTGRLGWSRDVGYAEDRSWSFEKVVERGNKVPDAFKDNEKILSIPLVPGDIVISEGHSVMIRSLSPDKNRVNEYKDIVFIESASGAKHEYRVLCNQTLWTYFETYGSWITPSYRFKRFME